MAFTGQVLFKKRGAKISRRSDDRRAVIERAVSASAGSDGAENLKAWFQSHNEEELFAAEARALEQEFGSDLERTIVTTERNRGVRIADSRLIRKEYIRRFVEGEKATAILQSA